jgi:Ca2+-binding EF-hand superfamily protein
MSISESKRGNKGHESSCSIQYFTNFLKNKVDKKRTFEELKNFAIMMDIDQDGFIDVHDLNTVIGNLANEKFYKNNGEILAMTNGVSSFSEATTTDQQWFPKEKMSIAKAAEVVKAIKEALILKQISFRSLFQALDNNNNCLLSFAEFNTGIEKYVSLSPIIKQQLFALMDVNGIGMVDYESFLEVMNLKSVSKPKAIVADTFNWEE